MVWPFFLTSTARPGRSGANAEKILSSLFCSEVGLSPAKAGRVRAAIRARNLTADFTDSRGLYSVIGCQSSGKAKPRSLGCALSRPPRRATERSTRDDNSNGDLLQT